MANIIYDEKRVVRLGEVSAINLKNIHATYLTLNNEFDNIVNFYSERNGISSDNDITFVKYLGNGFFMDLVSDQLLMTEIYDVDDFGTDEFHLLDTVSQDELTKMKDYWNLIQNPIDVREFKDSFSILWKIP